MHVLQQILRGYFGIPEGTAHRALADSQVLSAMTQRLLEMAFAMPGINNMEMLMKRLPKNGTGRVGDLPRGIEHHGDSLVATPGVVCRA